MDIDGRIEHYRKMVECYLGSALPERAGMLNPITRCMRYSLFAGGKRIRPLLMLGTGEIYGADEYDILPFAGCIEMIHTYSLIHDDLPGMDDDDLRRGKPTNHRVFGEGMAILAGDGLLNLAYETMLSEVEAKRDLKYASAAYEIAKGAGIYGMVGGQAVDIDSSGKRVDRDTVEFMHNNKTGALITASVTAGAIISEAPTEDIRLLADYGRCLGLAFQITDDILDAVGEAEKVGKSVGSDERENKPTYVSIYGVERSKRIAADLTDEALGRLDKFGFRAEFLRSVTRRLLVREF